MNLLMTRLLFTILQVNPNVVTMLSLLPLVYQAIHIRSAFSALMQLVGQQEEHPAHIRAGVVWCWHCLTRGANDMHMVQLMPLPPHHLCFNKIQNSLSFWYRAIAKLPAKKPLNKSCCCYWKNYKNRLALAWRSYWQKYGYPFFWPPCYYTMKEKPDTMQAVRLYTIAKEATRSKMTFYTSLNCTSALSV